MLVLFSAVRSQLLQGLGLDFDVQGAEGKILDILFDILWRGRQHGSAAEKKRRKKKDGIIKKEMKERKKGRKKKKRVTQLPPKSEQNRSRKPEEYPPA